MAIKYPIKFLDAYNSQDKDIFFGRDEEIEALYEMAYQSDILFVYGASGAGKTSLIQCGLSIKFALHEWLPLYIRRGTGINHSFEKALDGAIERARNTEEPENEYLDAILNRHKTSKQQTYSHEVIDKIATVYQSYFRPIYLVFDQFEELYIFGETQEQRAFFGLVQNILSAELPVKFIFSIREEYLGFLNEFERVIPQLLNKKIRIEAMNLDKVKQVIQGITEHLQSNIRLISLEREIIPQAIFDKVKERKNARTIQLPYLQVFLDKLYLQITKDHVRQATAFFSLEAIEQMRTIDDILEEFLDDQVIRVQEHMQRKQVEITNEKIWQILSPFATLEGTKKPMYLHEIYKKLDEYDRQTVNEIIEALEESRIIRYNEREEYYEMAHDSLAQRVSFKRKKEERDFLEAERLLRNQAQLRSQHTRELFSEKQLNYIDAFIDRLALTDVESELISESRKNVALNKRRQKRRFMIILGLAVIMIMILALTYWAVNEKWNAVNESNRAKRAELSAKRNASAHQLAVTALRMKTENPTLAFLLTNYSFDFADNNNRNLVEEVRHEIYSQNEQTPFYSALLIGHNDIIHAVAFSPDGQSVITGSEDNEAILWGLNGAWKQKFRGHKGAINSLAFSPKRDTVLVSGSQDSLAILWDLRGNPVKTFTGHQGAINSIAFSPDGQSILTGSDDETARLWSLDKGLVKEFKGHKGAVNSVAFAPNGRSVLTGSDDGTARLWNLTGGLVKELRGHEGAVNSVAFAPDGRSVLTGSDDGIARLWNLNGGLVKEFKGHREAINSAVFSPNGLAVLTGSEDGTARLWNLEGYLLKELKGNFKGVLSVAFSPDDKLIVTGNRTPTAILWETGEKWESYATPGEGPSNSREIIADSVGEYLKSGLVAELSYQQHKLYLLDEQFNYSNKKNPGIVLEYIQSYLQRSDFAPPQKARLYLDSAIKILKNQQGLSGEGFRGALAALYIQSGNTFFELNDIAKMKTEFEEAEKIYKKLILQDISSEYFKMKLTELYENRKDKLDKKE